MRSQELRKLGPEIDPLKLSMDWTPEDLDLPQVLVDDVWGDALPGSYHLKELSEAVSRGVFAGGGKPALFHVTDMCDGIAQGTEGMNYSLLSREIICDMVEIHWQTQPVDALVLLSSCDKGVPAHLKSLARMSGAAGIHVPGGTMLEGPGMFTLEQVGAIYSQLRRGQIKQEEYCFLQRNACPTEGCCSFMGTANTMQSLSEALGLALPGAASMPAFASPIRQKAESAGRRIVRMLDEGLVTKDILTKEAFENAIMVHAAIGGSTNALLHLPTIARELGIALHPMLLGRHQPPDTTAGQRPAQRRPPGHTFLVRGRRSWSHDGAKGSPAPRCHDRHRADSRGKPERAGEAAFRRPRPQTPGKLQGPGPGRHLPGGEASRRRHAGHPAGQPRAGTRGDQVRGGAEGDVPSRRPGHRLRGRAERPGRHTGR